MVLLIHLDSWLAYFRYFALSRCEHWWNVCFLDVESLAWLSLLWFSLHCSIHTHIPRTMEISVVNARESEDSKALHEMMEAAWHEATNAQTYPSLLYWLHSFEFFEEILLFFEQVCCETLARYTKQCQAQWYILWQMRSYVGGFLPAKVHGRLPLQTPHIVQEHEVHISEWIELQASPLRPGKLFHWRRRSHAESRLMPTQ